MTFKETTELSATEYQGLNFDLQEVIKKAVQKDEILWYNLPMSEPDLPKYVEVKVERGKVWWINFFKNTLLELKP